MTGTDGGRLCGSAIFGGLNIAFPTVMGGWAAGICAGIAPGVWAYCSADTGGAMGTKPAGSPFGTNPGGRPL
jgi:hypothetical protein